MKAAPALSSPFIPHSHTGILLPALASLALFATSALGQLLEYEGFDYQSAVIAGQSGGTGWGVNAWTDPDADTPLSNDGVSLANPVSLTYSPVGSRIAFPISGEAERRLGTTMALTNEAGTFFCSALVKQQGSLKFEFMDNSGNIRWHFGSTNSTDAIAGVGVNAGQFGLLANGFPPDQTVFVVCKILTKSNSTASDLVYMNVYRAGDIVPAAEPSTWQVSGGSASGVILTRLQIRNYIDVPAEVDEIRVGRTYADVASPLASGPPVVYKQPAGMTNYQGMTAQFQVEATGAVPLSYQWRLNDAPVSGATQALLLLTNIQPAQAGAYTVVVTNSSGSTTSNPALLGVLAATNINVGLAGFWNFNENTGLVATDSSPNLNNGALVNFIGDDSQWINGYFGGGLAFAGNNLVEVPDSPTLRSNLINGFTVAAWFRSNVGLSTNGNTSRMLEKENSVFLLQGDGNPANLGSGGMNMLVKKGGANLAVAIGQALDANRWYHLVGTFDGAQMSIYLDGELKGTRAVAAPIDTSMLPMHIGSDYAASGQKYLNGAMDEVGVWERPLLLSEILQLADRSGPPRIRQQPVAQTKYLGGTATFQLDARGQSVLRYIWYHGTTEIRGVTGPVLTLVNVQPLDAGEYHCKVSNALGDIVSDTVTLTVNVPATLADGMEGLWNFNDGSGLVALDSSGKSRDGQLVDYLDPASAWTTGQVGGALNFDGTMNRVVPSNGSSLNLGTDATISFWIKPTSYGTFEALANYNRYIGRVLYKAGHIDIQTIDDPGSVRATIVANGVAAQQYSLALNEWQHWTVVFQGGTLSFYKNGFRLGDPLPGSIGAAGTNVLVLGNNSDQATPSSYFAGSMDEVGVWSRVLSDTEILGLAERDLSAAPVIVRPPSAAVRYEGASVTMAVDATGKRPLTYEWRRDGSPIPNSNTDRLLLTNLSSAHAGGYTVQVANSLGQAVSTPPATLTVLQVTNVTTGLVAYWPFDETSGTTLLDASGHGHHAALQNSTAAEGNLGIIGGAMNFDGVSAFAVVPHAPDLNLADQVTISLWINPRSLGAASAGYLGRIVRKDVNYDLMTFGSSSTLRAYGLNKTIYDAPANSLVLNQWQHVAMVVRDGTIQFFKNGRALANPIPGFLGPAVTNDLVIANFGPDMTILRLFDGYMDDLGIWNRALNAAEIDGIYQNGALGKSLTASFEPLQIRGTDLPTASQIRITFYSPYLNRQHAIEGQTDLGGTQWAAVSDVTFTPLGNGLFQASFERPAAGTGFYRVALLPPPPLFSETFESGAPGWSHGGIADNWEIGVPVHGPGAAFSGTKVAATGLTSGSINPYSYCYLRSPVIDLTGVTRATLTFMEWRHIDNNLAVHGTTVSVLDPNGNQLQQLSAQTGTVGDYTSRTLPLPPQLLGQRIILDFSLYSDNVTADPVSGAPFEGWYIDDVQILPQ